MWAGNPWPVSSFWPLEGVRTPARVLSGHNKETMTLKAKFPENYQIPKKCCPAIFTSSDISTVVERGLEDVAQNKLINHADLRSWFVFSNSFYRKESPISIFWTHSAVRDMRTECLVRKGGDTEIFCKNISQILSMVDLLRQFPESIHEGRVAGTLENSIIGTNISIPYTLNANVIHLLGLVHGRPEDDLHTRPRTAKLKTA